MSLTDFDVDVGIEVERCFESSRLEKEFLATAYEIVAPISIAPAANKSRSVRSRTRFPRGADRESWITQGARL